MQQNDANVENVVAGLKALAEGAFPQSCASCGKVYASVDQLIAETGEATDSPESVATGRGQVAVARRCSCGHTLQLAFEERRAQGEIADKRRNLFGHLLDILVEGGMPPGMAKAEIMKVMRGEPSTLLTTEQLQRLFADQ